MPILHYNGEAIAGRTGETVLETLLNAGLDVKHACRSGRCKSCLLQCEDGRAPRVAQSGLHKNLAHQGYFLPCRCPVQRNMLISSPSTLTDFQPVTVTGKETLSPRVCRLHLRALRLLPYQAGQAVNLRRPGRPARLFALSSIPEAKADLEIQVEVRSGGELTPWLYEVAEEGAQLEMQGPEGYFFYLPGRPEQNMLLIGDGAAVGSLCAIVKSALIQGHTGTIVLYHGARKIQGLYLHSELKKLEEKHRNFHYFPCVSKDDFFDTLRQGQVADIALGDFLDLVGWRVFVSGSPDMVGSAKVQAYIAGANSEDILADPFDGCAFKRFPDPYTF